MIAAFVPHAALVNSAPLMLLGDDIRPRLGCCLHYTIRPAEACLTCPRTGDDERLRRLAGDAEGDTAD